MAEQMGMDALLEADPLARQVQLALAFLVLGRAGTVRRDELADVLWAEDLPRSWNTAIRGVVVRNDFVDFEKFLLEADKAFEVIVTGGVESGIDLQRSLAKGARAVQLDSVLVREGPRVFERLEHELRQARRAR